MTLMQLKLNGIPSAFIASRKDDEISALAFCRSQLTMEDLSSLIDLEELRRAAARAEGVQDVRLCGPIEVKRATKAVEGFTSLVLRVTYQLEDHRRRVLVVKRMPSVESQVELAKQCRVFEREGAFFDRVVPLMEAVAKGRVELPLPKCYLIAAGQKDNDAIFMEDLADRGYRTPGIEYLTEGLDLPHCLVVFKKLGILHGAAVAAERSLESAGWAHIKEFSRDAICYETDPSEPPMPLLGMVEKGLETVETLSKELDGMPKEALASGALAKVFAEVWPSMCRMVRPDPNGRNLLNHGDSWMRNMMFRYEEHSNDPSDVKFVDLQIVRYCNPSIDINYFMYLNTVRSFRDRHMKKLVREYYESLSESLRVMDAGLPPFSLEELMSDILGEYRFFGVIIGVLFAPILRQGEDFVPSTAEEMTPEQFKEFFETGSASKIRARFARDPKYRAIMEEIIREFVEVAVPRVQGLSSE